VPTQTDVKPDPSTGDVKAESSPADESARLKADNERLKGALSNLQSERDAVTEELTDLRDIKRRYGELSARQQAREDQLKSEKSDIASQIDELKRKPEAKPWFANLDIELEKTRKAAAEEGRLSALADLSWDFLEDKAEELAKDEEYKGLNADKLKEKISKFYGQHSKKNVYRAVQLAYRDWQEAESYKKEKAEAARKKAEGDNSREDGGRIARESSAGDLMNKKGDLSHVDKSALREKLGIMQRSR
jgi:hypothetical protein